MWGEFSLSTVLRGPWYSQYFKDHEFMVNLRDYKCLVHASIHGYELRKIEIL